MKTIYAAVIVEHSEGRFEQVRVFESRVDADEAFKELLESEDVDWKDKTAVQRSNILNSRSHRYINSEGDEREIQISMSRKGRQ